ncbi:hypothetical protein TRFO_13049 [Tritrichomonas foetus]|uniref:Uncharacterized protein n=1 Tax=Tritrichomonas foetus TaxID=1144522 RepID=A0A1J4L3Y3_9EUKA|nr:hypothetical protein TRFO_13049 [Tritrichomonas foetus]|eukprot:OHT16629.1 hypothetical protein TRFO_13049 [Tritrichomonas foetus]
MIQLKNDDSVNSRARIAFLAQQHSYEMTNFLKSNREFDDDNQEFPENTELYEELFRSIFDYIDRKDFPADQLVTLCADLETDPFLINLIKYDFRLLSTLSEIIPDVLPEFKSYIFQFFSILIQYSKTITETLLENHLLINICRVLLDENIPAKFKIYAAECLHYFASQSKDNILICFNNISIPFNHTIKNKSPISCIIYILSEQMNDEDPIMKEIQALNGKSFETDPEAQKLRKLLLKFLVAIVNTINLPKTQNSAEIVDEILKASLIKNDDLMDLAIYGVSLAADQTKKNSVIFLNFLNTFKNQGYFQYFLNLLDTSPLMSVRSNVLLTFKSILENNKLESEMFINVNFLDHLIHHMEPEENDITRGIAIDLFVILFQSNKEFMQEIIKKEIIQNYLLHYFDESSFLVKKAITIAIYHYLNQIDEPSRLSFFNQYLDLFEKLAGFMMSGISYDEMEIIFNILSMFAFLYKKNNQNDELLKILQEYEILSSVDELIMSEESEFRFLATGFKSFVFEPLEDDE